MVAVAAIGVGWVRGASACRGGVPGWASELALVLTAVAVLLAEPMSHRVLVARVGVMAATVLAVIAVWPRGRHRQLAVLTSACAGVLSVIPEASLVGGIELIVAAGAAAAVAWWLSALLPSNLAAVTTIATAVATAGEGVTGWLLPLVVAAAVWCVSRDRPWDAALLAVVAAGLAPSGIGVSIAVIGVASAAARSVQPTLLLVPAVLIWWWLLPKEWSPLLDPGTLLSMLVPVLLLPMALTGLVRKAWNAVRTRQTPWSPPSWTGWISVLGLVLGLGGAVAGGGGAGATIAVLLLAVPRGTEEGMGWAVRTLPWTAAAAGTVLLLASSGMSWPVALGPGLVGLWLVSWLATAVRHRVVQLAWIAPILMLPWVVPVEGVDRRLAAGARLEAPRDGTGLVVQIGSVRAGTDRPWREAAATAAVSSVPLVTPRVDSDGLKRWVVELAPGTALAITADSIVRTEPLSQWRHRLIRCAVLAAGGCVLAGAVVWLSPGWGPVAAAWLVAWLLAAGSGVAPLARLGVRDAADAATALWLLCIAVAVPRLGRRWFAAGLLVLLPLALVQPLLRHPAGDEVYHTMLLQSLLADGDLDISNNIDLEDPAESIYAPHGSELIHSPTVALIVAPGWLVAGHAGALAVLAALAAAAAALIARRSLELGVPLRSVRWAWWLTVSTYPLVTFATQLWPAVPGAFLVAVLLAALGRQRPLTAAVAVAASVLIKVRLALISVPVAVAWAVQRRHRRWLPVLLAGGVAGALGVVAMYGSPLGRHSVLELVPDAPAVLLVRLWGIVCDGAGGILLHAPLWLVALAGVVAVWRRGGVGERGVILGAVLTVLVLTNRGEWYGGGSPPARYLVPLLPLVQMALAETVRRRGGRRLTLLAVPWVAVVSWVAVTRPLWLFNPVDGGWWWVDRLGQSLGMDVRRLLPSVLAPSLATVLVPLGLAVLAGWWWRSRMRSSAAVTLGLGAAMLIVATGVPSRVVEAEAGGVATRGGQEQPPPGTFARAAGDLGWRLVHDASLEVRWRLPYGRRPWARVELIGDRSRVTRLWVQWGSAAPREVVLNGMSWSGRRWRWLALPPPPKLGTSVLRIRFDGAPEAWRTHVVIDRLEAR